jgi:predicted dehydrogenase
MYNVAVVGYGYWGPNIVRNFNHHPSCEVKYICDLNDNNLKRARELYSDIEIISEFDKIINDNSINIVAIVTPVSTHFELAFRVLKSNKHLFIEKPMVQSSKEADILINIANDNNLVGVVDHTFLFTGSVKKIKEIIDSGEIGELVYFDSTRVNLGIFQNDIDVIWDLAPHDLSILFYIKDEMPTTVNANGVDIVNNGLVDIAYLNLEYDHNMIANFHLNWFSPIKIRRIIIGGSKKMIVFDDMETSEKIKVYDSGISVKSNQEEIRNLQISYRTGDMYSPQISPTEALKCEIDEFIDTVQGRLNKKKNDLIEGKKIVRILEKAKTSLEKNSKVML